jgi:hypothetical protein
MNTTRTAIRLATRHVSNGMATAVAARAGRRDVPPGGPGPAEGSAPFSAQSAAPSAAAPVVQPPERAAHATVPLPALGEPTTPRLFTCRCGRPVFFRNSECLACHTPLGYDSHARLLLPLEPATDDRQAPVVAPESHGGPAPQADSPWWRAFAGGSGALRFRRCSNLDTAAACNWLVAESDTLAGEPPLCRCCRLTRTVPDLTQPNAGVWWNRIELAKRRLVSSLIGLQLPVQSKAEDPERGLVFDLLCSQPGQQPVVTGHADGVITLDVEEADDPWREQRRVALGEPYRTLLGHLRHESGHYYWQRLVDNGPWLKPFREAFGDERQDYTLALRLHYRNGAPADWGARFVSSYASSHPWEDWAETWAHYLHLVDTLDTAHSFGLDGERVELSYERFGDDVVGQAGTPQAAEFLRLINSWMELTGVLNELSRSMGVPDFYPFVLSQAAVRKLFVVHQVIRSASGAV